MEAEDGVELQHAKDDRCINTGDMPLMLSYEQWCDKVLDSHYEVIELFKSLETK